MSRDSPSRRLIFPAEPIVSAVSDGASTPAARPLITLLARSPQLVDVLPHLHQHALEVTGGSCSVLFEHNPRNQGLQATSGFGLDELLPDPWAGSPSEQAVVDDAFDRNRPTFVPDLDRQMPDLARRLGAVSGALLLPLVQGTRRIGLFAVGFRTPAGGRHDWDGAAEIADGLVTTLELFRFRRNEEFQRELRELLAEVATSLSSSLNVAAGLDSFCDRANRLFAADRTSVWLHDRRLQHITIKASSHPDQVARGTQVNVDDALAPAALALRSVRAESHAGAERLVPDQT